MAPLRVITEVAALDRAFDYAENPALGPIGVGDRVRVELHGRSVRGWVVAQVTSERELKSVRKWLGYGPPPSMIDLAQWASDRWCGPVARFLAAASPSRVVTSVPTTPPTRPLASSSVSPVVRYAPGVVQLAPTTDPLGLVLHAYEATRLRKGSLVVLVPSDAWAARLRGRLEQRGCAVAGAEQWDRMRAGWPVIVGSRGAALCPAPRLAGAVVLDADDEAYVSSAQPTWDAVSMVRERARRDDAPTWFTTMMPSPSLAGDEPYQRDADLVGGWPRVEVVDRRGGDPHDGALSARALTAAHRALDGEEAVAVAVVLQRLGTGRLIACDVCGELARCAVCAQAEEDVDGGLACRERHEPRARFCRHCGSTRLRVRRAGVATLARDVAAQLGQPVSEVTATSDPAAPLARVVVGTTAVLRRVRRCSLVIVADVDQYLLAARASARRDVVYAVGGAGRLVGSRREGRGLVLIQTRRGDDPVLDALVRADFDDLVDEDRATARLLALPPYGAVAEVTGEGAAEFVAGLADSPWRVSPTPEGFVVRGPNPEELGRALRVLARPAARVRVAVH